jgi:Tfp pilus assembly pilus retraction ATPase PilT
VCEPRHGHLCAPTLHANNANQAIQRILNFFPETAHRQVLMDLSLNLKGVVGQRLIRGASARLVPAVEVMLLSPYVPELIQKGQTDDLQEAMAKSNELVMATFDQSLCEPLRALPARRTHRRAGGRARRLTHRSFAAHSPGRRSAARHRRPAGGGLMPGRR